MATEKKLILVGVISSAHGIKGQVLVKSYTQPVSNIAKFNILDSNNVPIKIKMIRVNSKNNVICKIEDCNDRTMAEKQKGRKLYCDKDDLPILDSEEFYIELLKGLKVKDDSGAMIGVVANIANYGAGDIVEIKFNDNKEEMFPFTKDIFPEITKDHIILCSPVKS